MKNRGNLVKTEQNQAKLTSNPNNFPSRSDLWCMKHPLYPSSVGICALCLTEKLINLVCSDCGEQRMSSCSCGPYGPYSSDSASYRNSSSNRYVGSVGRVSFLIGNENGGNKDDKNSIFSQLKVKQGKTGEGETGEGVVFKRSNSCVVGVKKTSGFWGIGSFFKKKREKERGGLDQESEGCVRSVSRSRSLSAKVLDFNEIESRKSGIRGGFVDFGGGFSVKDKGFRGIDDDNEDDEFIDLEIDLFGRSKTEHSVFKKCDQLGSGGGGDRGVKKVKKCHVQAWKWMFKHHSEKDDHSYILRS